MLSRRAAPAHHHRHPATRGVTGGSRGTALLGAVSLSVLAVALPAFLVALIEDVGRSEAWVLTLLVMSWAGVRLSLLMMRGKACLFDMFFWLYTYIFMGLAPSAAIRSGLVPDTTPGIDPSLDLPAALVIVLGVVAYELGRLAAIPRERRRLTARVARPARISPNRTAILLVVGALVSAYYIAQVGPAFLQPTRDAGNIARAAIWPDPAVRAIFLVASLFPILIALGAVLQLRARAIPALRRPLLLLAIICLLIIFSVVSPISSARYTFGTVAFALAVYAGALATPFRVRATMIGTFGGLLFLFPAADAFRRAGQQEEGREGFFAEYLNNPDYDSFWQIANAYAYVQDGLVEPLRQLVGSALFWVPRSIWADKPTDTGILLADYRGYTFDNLSAPLWAEALVNGGVIGVALMMAIVGYGARRLDARMAPAFVTGGVWLIVGAVFPVYGMILLRGSLLQATGGLVVALVCVVFVHQRRRPAPPREPVAAEPEPKPQRQASYSDSS
jgi:hypothetical protein